MPVYLIHFDSALAGHARHYIGYAGLGNVKRRFEHHKAGRGARILSVCNERGISYFIVRIWKHADKSFERRLKKYKNAADLCPVCNSRAMSHMCNVQQNPEPDSNPALILS